MSESQALLRKEEERLDSIEAGVKRDDRVIHRIFPFVFVFVTFSVLCLAVILLRGSSNDEEIFSDVYSYTFDYDYYDYTFHETKHKPKSVYTNVGGDVVISTDSKGYLYRSTNYGATFSVSRPFKVHNIIGYFRYSLVIHSSLSVLKG